MRKTNFNWLCSAVAGVVLCAVAGASAQQTKPGEPPAGGTATQPKAAPATKAAAPAPAGKTAALIGDDPRTPELPRRDSFDLTLAQEERFKKLLPKTLAKLTSRERFHIVTIGDSVVEVTSRQGAGASAESSYAEVFARELATQFYYTGGMRVIRPAPVEKAAKGAVPQLGPEITLRSLGRDGKLMIHAMQTLTTYGFEHQPDLVMVSFGINDARAGLNLASYAKALQEVIETVRSRGAELILLGPTLVVDDPAEESLGLTRAYLDTMREVAADSGVLFVDLGDLASLVAVGDAVTEPAAIFEQIVKQYRRFFPQADAPDYMHPLAEMHRILGKRIFSELTSGAAPSAWAVTAGSVTLESSDKFTLRYDLKNTSGKDEALAVLPLVVREWKPMDASPQVALKPGESKTMQVSYSRRAGVTGGIPSHEPVLRLPVLVSGAGMTRIEDVRAEMHPLTLLWKLTTLFNQEKSFPLENLLCNSSAAPLKGTWTAEWLGQKRKGDFSLAAGEQKPIELSFDLPTAAEPWRQTAPVTVEVAAGGIKMRLDREIEVSRNIGLKQTVSLTPLSASGKAPALAAETPGVRLKTDADVNALYLIYEITGFSLEDAGADRGAFEYELRLDARSYGKRLGLGAVDALQLSGRAADGVYPFGDPPPWVFGTGYAATYDPKFIRGQLSSSGSGKRRFTVTLPRSYLYLHEWAIGNGNSQIGIQTNISFWKGPRDAAPGGDYPADLSFALVSNGRHPDDAEGLAVIELTDKPTLRWTVNPY